MYFVLLHAQCYIHFTVHFFIAQQHFYKYLFTIIFALLLHFS